ncbi:MAG: ABC transporter ATP-binding protein [Candidatus Heimdallarchaeota archaeon]|nr:ABC transporter ATP-binding protein [Candidatus Heimdallarchaeota archaeon]MCK4769924.1 ABC transporter ATP-binding protein [Candidatus Heimdallarchaeota archaeon]
MSSDVILKVENLTKIYGREIDIRFAKIGKEVLAVKDVSFSVNKGEIFGFLGPNGAGKTTTMRAILNYLRIQKGKISVFGLDHNKDSIEIRKRLGYIPGELGLYEDFTGEELIKYVDKFRPINQKFLKELKTVFRVNLSQKIRSLSHGNKQQVGLLIALAPKPEFLILDEPSLGLDPLMTANFHKILRKLREEGITIFLSSHNLSEVQSICDRVGIIKEGEIILIEEIENLKMKFLQNVRIKLPTPQAIDEEEIVKLDSVISCERVNETTLVLKVKENISEFLNWIKDISITRITIEDASLEEIFLHYYE